MFKTSYSIVSVEESHHYKDTIPLQIISGKKVLFPCSVLKSVRILVVLGMNTVWVVRNVETEVTWPKNNCRFLILNIFSSVASRYM